MHVVDVQRPGQRNGSRERYLRGHLAGNVSARSRSR